MVDSKDVYLVLGGDVFVGRHVVEQLKARIPSLSLILPKDTMMWNATPATSAFLSNYPTQSKSSSGVVFDGRDIVNGDETLPYPKKPLDPYTASRASVDDLISSANDSHGLGLRTTYVRNVAPAILLAPDKLSDPAVADQVAGQTFFIMNNDPRLFWDFMRSLWAGFDAMFPDRPKPAPKKLVVIPHVLALLLAYVIQFFAWVRGDRNQIFTPYTVIFSTAKMYFSSAKARRVLGYEPQVGVEEEIKRTMARGAHCTVPKWLKAEYDTGNSE
ncbi:hypothetical protein B0H19DRAFT_1062127 [Mycena capillaripes]|nr:hypothetical protein B0H19DRAFT_1062127 [Mycena capillaripes]